MQSTKIYIRKVMNDKIFLILKFSDNISLHSQKKQTKLNFMIHSLIIELLRAYDKLVLI